MGFVGARSSRKRWVKGRPVHNSKGNELAQVVGGEGTTKEASSSPKDEEKMRY